MGRTSVRRWGRLGAVVVLGGLMSFTAAGVAAAADATTTPVKGVAGIGEDGKGRKGFLLYDKDNNRADAALITLAIEGGKPAEAYCIDINNPLNKGGTYQETAWKASEVANLDKVQWILTNSFPKVEPATVLKNANLNPDSVKSEDRELLVYAATQGAIWHFSDGFGLHERNGADYDVVEKVYAYLIGGAEKAQGVKEPAPTLSITPASATGEVGSKLGPFTVKSPVEAAALKATGGKIVDSNGAEVTGPVKDGGKFWLTSDQVGKVTVDASATGTVPTGRVFTFPLPSGTTAKSAKPEKFQKIILAGEAKAELVAHASGTFTPKAAVPTLPVTGASAVGAAVGGVALLGGGGLLVVMLRRRRVKFTA